jgi:hypothetical protein
LAGSARAACALAACGGARLPPAEQHNALSCACCACCAIPGWKYVFVDEQDFLKELQ